MDEPKHNSKAPRINIAELLTCSFLDLERRIRGPQPKSRSTWELTSPEVYISKVDEDVSIMILCLLWSQMRSKDPNTKVGAAVYDKSSGSLHLGYNGFNKGVIDEVKVWDNRDVNIHPNKYDRVVHAESNSLEKALKASFNPATSILYVTNWPCRICVKNHVVPSGIKTMHYLDSYPWDEESEIQLKMAKVEFHKLNLSI